MFSVGFQEPPMIEAVCLPSHCSRRSFRSGPKPGCCLTRAQHHSQNSSKISQKAPCAPFLQPFHLLPHGPSFHPPQLLHHESLPSLHAQLGDAMSLTAFVPAAGAFSAASHPATLSQLQHTSALAGASCIPRQNQGPLAQGMARRHAKSWFPASEKFPPQKRESAE